MRKDARRILTLLLLMWNLLMLHAQTYDKLWKEVELAQEKSLPQTVVKLTDGIYRKAQKEQNAPQLLKAYVCREQYKERLTPDSLYTRLKDMERWVRREKSPVNKAILHSLLAYDYAGLMEANRYNRSKITPLEADTPLDDIRMWGIIQFMDKIHEHATASLHDSLRLLEASAEAYAPFVVTEEGSRFYRHDMYHLMGTRAVSVYKKCTGLGRDERVQERIHVVYSRMIDAYRRRAGMEDAVLLCSLDYLNWKRDLAEQRRASEAGNEYLNELDTLIREFGNRQVCAEVYIKKADYLHAGTKHSRLSQAMRVCDEGLKRYPSYPRINALKAIREEIMQPQLDLSLPEGVYPGDSVEVNVKYRNLKGFTLQVYATTLREVPRGNEGQPVDCSAYRKQARRLSAMHFDLESLPQWNKPSEDVPYLLADNVFRFKMPQEAGVYIVRLLPDGDAGHAKEDFLVSTRFKVLTLKLGDGCTELIALDASTGHPIADAGLSFYTSTDGSRKLLTELTTGNDGKIILSLPEGVDSYVARKGDDTAMLPQSIYKEPANRRNTKDEWEHITLLTDRAIYRPGQTVYVKGIAYKQNNDSAHVQEGSHYELELLDVNGKQLATQTVRSNDFGSFTTEFILPSACLNGRFTIRVQNPTQYASFRVEEYKRPSFEVTIDPLSVAYRFGERILLKGNVRTFNGMTVQDVPLAYRLTCRDFGPGRGYDEKPVLADTIQLEKDGTFSIPLTLQAPEGYNSRFGGVMYRLEATVTGETGETQTAEYRFEASPKAYDFDILLPKHICKEDDMVFTLRVRNRNFTPLQIKGTYRIYPVSGLKAGVKAKEHPAVLEGNFDANRPQNFSQWRQLKSGNYRLVVSVSDSLGRKEDSSESASGFFVLFSKQDKRPVEGTDLFYYAEQQEFDAQRPAAFLLGASFPDAYVLMDVFCDGKRIESRTLLLNDTLVRMEYPYKETYGEGVTLLFNSVKNGQRFEQMAYLSKRKPAHRLDMKWEVFRDRLRPGQKEEWKLTVKTAQGTPAAAEVLATMYDASLDKIYRHNQLLEVYLPGNMSVAYRRTSYHDTNYLSIDFPRKDWTIPEWLFDRFFFTESSLYEEESIMTGYGIPRKGSSPKDIMIRGVSSKASAEGVSLAYVAPEVSNTQTETDDEAESVETYNPTSPPASAIRSNFAETAFFYPQLRTDAQGATVFSFTLPQSLTRWNFRGYSHTRDMAVGRLDTTAVTSKDFMLTPNIPRFVRVGDHTQLSASIANVTGKLVRGTATLTLFNPMTEKELAVQRRPFSVEAGRTTAVNFGFDVTESLANGLLGVRMVADGGAFSDGEQHLLPVLSDKIYLTETLSMPIRGGETRTFALDSLFNRNSATATDRRLTVEFTGNPAWYAVQALPVLSAPTYDNALSWATAYYANTLAGYIASSQPRIKAVFDRWKSAGESRETLLSLLEKRQDVKSVLISESPWLAEATTESERQARIATLFDVNQLEDRNLSAIVKLKELQCEDGGWSWCKGMYSSRFVTAYVTELLVRLPLLTKGNLPEEVADMRQKAFKYLHKRAYADYDIIRTRTNRKLQVSAVNSEYIMNYLYLIALTGEKVPTRYQAAYRYFLSKVKENLSDGAMMCKAQSAVILRAAGRTAEADAFIASLKEHLVRDKERGAYFAFLRSMSGWGMLPVSTHVAAMEALDGAGGNDELVEEMKFWLLKQKQTTAWNSPIATADAIYALLCRGSNLLESRGDVRITLGDDVLETCVPAKTTVPDLGYVRQTYTRNDNALKAKTVVVEKRDAGAAWGAVYAQYLSPIRDVKAHGEDMEVKKLLYVERITNDGRKSLQYLRPSMHLSVGDKVIIEILLFSKNDVDFVHLKDERSACLEPIGQLSGFRKPYGGSSYYVEIKDAATHFFLDHISEGVHFIKYSCRVVRAGTYQTGVATLQSLYAPEFAAHSEGRMLTVE